MRRSSPFLRTSLLVLGSLFIVVAAQAQYRGQIQGVVTDPAGAMVPGATVSLTDKETGRVQQATTNDDGVYNFGSLAPRRYSLSVEAKGFKKKSLEDFGIRAEQMNAVNVQLEVGQTTEVVNVTSDATPLIDTETAQLSGTVDAKQIQALPSFGRDVYQLAQLAPGVFGDGSRNQSGDSYSQPGNQGPGASGGSSGVFSTENRPQITANGGRQDQNNVTLDGIGITSVSWGGAAIVTPNEDSVKEVRVVSNSYDAENGRFSGASIQVLTNNGTNNYHGSFFFKVDRPGLNSFQNYTGTAGFPTDPQRNTNRFNNWGGSVGGPIIKNKLFAFFAYERIANGSTATGTNWFETPALLQSAPGGSIASQYGAYPGEAVAFSSINDVTCDAIGLVEGTNCHQIAGQGLDIGRPLDTTLFPLGTPDPSFTNNLHPGLGGDGTGAASNLDGIADIFSVNTAGPNQATNQQFNGRLDFNATSKDLIAFNIYKVPADNTSFNGGRPANLFHHHGMNEAETVLWDHTFSSSLLNELRVNAAGWRWNELKDNPQIPLGLPQTGRIGDPSNSNIGSVCPGCQGLGGPAGSIFDQWTYGLKDVVTKVHGSHSMKFGVEVTKLHFVQDAPWSARPNFYFKNYWDFLNDAPDLESGTFDPQTGAPTDVRKDSRSTILGFFAQDNWKVKPNLTINLGLRYEYFGPVSFLHNLLSAPVLGSGANALTDLHMKIGGNLWNADKGNFGPQLGFAWSPNRFDRKLVIRGGFGVAYNGEEQAITLNVWPNLPFNNGNSNFTGSQIVYAIPDDPHQFLPYPTNPNGVLNLDPNTHLPVVGSGIIVGVTGVPRNYATPYTYRYSLEGQYDLGANWVATLGYQGSQSRHQTRQYNLSQTLGAQGIALNPVVSDVDWYAHDGNAHFNALLTQLQHRFSRSFQFDMQYRYAKGSDNESGPYKTSYYVWDPGADWGPSDFDVTHAFKLYGIYSPTLFHGSRGWLEKLAGGWNFSGILNAHSGFPWTPVFNSSCNIVYNNGACYPNNGGNTFLMPVQYLGGAHSSTSNATFLRQGGNFPNGGAAYFVAPTFTDCTDPYPATCPIPQAPGHLRNAFRGPRYFDVDATISKAFGLPHMPVLGEGAQLEFRLNAYNVFNSLNLGGGGTDRDCGNIDNIVTDTHFGQVVPNCGNNGALGARTIEMQVRFSF
jgi:Carboxypeptidase regulatory-like domain/TonB dependent receptor-like, beta-barrel